MVQRFIHPRFPSLCLVGMLTSCETAPVNHLSWAPLVEEAVQSRIASPTGELFSPPNQQLIDDVRDRMPALLEASRFLAQVVTVVAEVAQTDYADEEARLPHVEEGPSPAADTTWGSSLYLRLACSGQDPLQPPLADFSAGEVRLDSPQLTSLELSSLIGGGEFLLSFRKCQLGPLLLDAALPGRYLVDLSQLGRVGGADAPPVVGIALSTDTVDYQGNAGPLGLVALGCGGQRACDEDLRTVAELLTGDGTFIISFRVLRSYWAGQEALSLTIRGKDAEATCSYLHGEGYAHPSLTCAP